MGKKKNKVNWSLKEKEKIRSSLSASQNIQFSHKNLLSENAAYSQTSKKTCFWLIIVTEKSITIDNTWNVPKIPVDPEVSIWRNDSTLENLLSHHWSKWVFSCWDISLDQPRIFRTWNETWQLNEANLDFFFFKHT